MIATCVCMCLSDVCVIDLMHGDITIMEGSILKQYHDEHATIKIKLMC